MSFKKPLCALIACAMLLSFALPCAAIAKKDFFRLHVIANSNSARDQEIKLKVRDAIVEAEESILAGSGSLSSSEARELIMQSASQLWEAVERTLSECNASYGAQLKIGRYSFPDKTYFDSFGIKRTLESGDYSALRVVLGNGTGENWWCVMFPPLCIVKRDKGRADGEGVEFRSFFHELFCRFRTR